MRRALAILVATVVAAAVTLTAQEARAAGEWPNRFRCTSGAFDLTSVTSELGTRQVGEIAVEVSGALTCVYPDEGASFALAYYPLNSQYAYIHPKYGFRPYAKGGPHPFTAIGGVLPGRPVTICVMSDVDIRIACLNVRENMAGRPGTVIIQVVSPSDISVDLPVYFVDNTTVPGCGGCWSVKP